jgi:hypothetical protein
MKSHCRYRCPRARELIIKLEDLFVELLVWTVNKLMLGAPIELLAATSEIVV